MGYRENLLSPSVKKSPKKGNRKQMHFMAVKKSRKRSGFVVHSYFKHNEFTAVKRDAKVLN